MKRYDVTPDGGIADQHGAILYDADSLASLAPAELQRLAQLHTEQPESTWEQNHAILLTERQQALTLAQAARTLQALLDRLAHEYRGLDEAIGLELWARTQGQGQPCTYLGALIDGHHEQISGSTPWEHQANLPTLAAKMTEIYGEYRKRRGKD